MRINIKKLMSVSALLAVATLIFSGYMALASDTTGALFIGIVTGTNNSTLAEDIAANFTLNTDDLIAMGQLNSSANNVIARDDNGNDTVFMPGFDGNPWIIYFESILEGASRNAYIYTGNVTGGDIVYFPGTAGANVTDNASLEWGASGNLTISGYFDPTSTGNLTSKPGAITVQGNGGGNIMVSIPSGSDDFSSDLWTDVGAGVGVNVGNSRMEWDTTNDAESSYRVVTSNFSNTSWTANFTYGATTAGASAIAGFGIIDSPNGDWGTSGTHDAIFVMINNLDIFARAWDGGALTSSGTITILLNTTYYITLARVTSTNMSISVFTDETRTTHIAGSPQTVAIPATVVGLGTLQVAGYTTGARCVGWMNDLSMTGGVSVTSPVIPAGEHTFNVAIVFPFAGLTFDQYLILPATQNLTLNVPLWQTECSTATFTSMDSNAYTCVVTGATWSEGYDFEEGDAADTIDPGFEPGALTQLTVEAWVKYETAAVDKAIWSTTATDDTRAISMRSNGLGIETGGLVGNQEQWNPWSFGNIPAGVWHHIVLGWDGANLYGYYDGALDGSPVAATGTLNVAAQNSQIGSRGGTTWWMDGVIGEVRFYNRSLTAVEVLQNYNSSKWRYLGGTTNYITSIAINLTDNSNNWSFVTGGIMTYVDYIEIRQSGVQTGYWRWGYSTLFYDQSGNGNTMTPSFRTTSATPM